MFGKRYRVTLNRVYDEIEVFEGDKTLQLTVNGEPERIVSGMTAAYGKLKTINSDMPDEEVIGIVRGFASVIFGDEQAEKLLEFYHGNWVCVVSVCSKYMTDRLNKLVLKAQKARK